MPKSDFYVGIDPSTLTGFVILNANMLVVEAREIVLSKGVKSTNSEIQEYGREIVRQIPANSKISIEWFALSAKGDAVSALYGIGYAIRYALNDANMEYFDVTPSALKKFTTGKGTSKKEIMIKEVYKRWGYEHDSNNVIDAYALARHAAQ